MTGYVPCKGDFITVSFDPQSGHEQRGRRPALVVSNDLFNRRTGLAIVCPLTSRDRGFPFHVPVGANAAVGDDPAASDDPAVNGFVMVEQVKSIDFRARRAKRIGKASTQVLEEALGILGACID